MGKKVLIFNQCICVDLESCIFSGMWLLGFCIFYEYEFMEQYGCLWMIVNKVFIVLVESGMIECCCCVGFFVVW